ncbi:hypothetical protein [Haloferax volcanii]|uniref:Integral membrane protein n=3 Tax=Haloferax volcanii TaxID=2246 RepID=A0A384LJJ4_HALVD|nr:hypothetical protein [Haloferax volcanii]ADE02633.1 uncharacterized protein HVO_1817 [Haloferax volcanii DS2]ELY35083.1 hypothetical protein C498_04393 [Haloferax volcanii DS2]MBS8120926.1 hypothetical protein [Haloferax volcanii]MBS8125963.1 hypothetical protein [Haloferax volcanii]MBS8129816.1 hypothetical protein [Haloferax volcanii]
MRWSLRAVLGSLQLPVAGAGVALLAFVWRTAVTMPPPPPGSDGFAHGLAGFFLLVFGVAGFVLLAGGLLIPPGPGYGVRFTRRQRWLFAYALVAPALAVGGFLATVVASSALGGVAVSAVSLVALTAPLAVLIGVGWRGAQAAAARF